jgi:hypothetical protein
MAATAEMPQGRSAPSIADWARRHTGEWCEMCDAFKAKTQQTMLAREPSAVELEEHRLEMKTFLRITRLLHAEVADPDFLERSLASALAIRLRQMEDLWEMIHNPMPDEEADKLLEKAFPK